MKSLIKFTLLFFIAALVIGGCSRNRIMRAPDLPSSVTALTEELTARATDKKEVHGQKIILTSIVDVNDFSQTSNFGRLYSDSLMTNLERFGWKVIDFRGINVIAKVKDGEFYLDRSKLKDYGDDYLVVVGTYGIYDKQLLVNVRILEPSSNRLVVSSNVLIDDEETVKLALTNHCKDLKCSTRKKGFNMLIKSDDCETTSRCDKCDNSCGDKR